jgi:molybdopterin synthase catalytic subunit
LDFKGFRVLPARAAESVEAMKVRVLFFGASHDITGFDEDLAEFGNGEASAGELRRRYEARFPPLREMGASLLMAVNQEFRPASWPLKDGDEVAFLPPVSGGHDGASGRKGRRPADFFVLTRQPIPAARLADELKAATDGAVVVFEGIVRDHSGDRRTLYLEYEAYEAMALAKMTEIGHEAVSRFKIDRIGVIHRLGRIEIGETSVAIVVTSEHRQAAFEACRYAIDRLKQVVPIWKKEYFEGGFVWAEGEQQAVGSRQ